MLKTLLVLCGVLVISATGLQAQGARGAIGRGGSFASARPSAYHGYNHGGYYNGYGRHGGYGGRYYYLGGVPYFYPFGFGFGYPSYYGDFYGGFGDGYGGGYGYGAGGYGGGYGYGAGGYGAGGYANNAEGAYEGRVVNNANPTGNGGQSSGASLPEAVQRQLAKRGYYKGSVDGQFGAESRSALTRFQKKQGIKETGKIDEPTLEALGFTDRR